MFRKLCYLYFFIFLGITLNNPKIVYSDEIKFRDKENSEWENILINSNDKDWTLTDKPYDNESNSEENFEDINLYNFAKKPFIRSIGQSITFNGYPYPDLSIYVPNGFLTDQDRVMTIGLRGIGRVRHCGTTKLLSENCTDAVLNIDTSIFKGDNLTFDLKTTIASLSNRGTDFGEGVSLGFKTAFKEINNWSFALGGDHLYHFDEHTDLGRNLYAVTSKAFILNNAEKPAILFLSGGLGTDFYGYKGNGYLGRINCFGKKNITGEGTDQCQIGPIFSGSLAFNDRISLGAEWFGYGFAAGISTRPIYDMPISFTLSITDFMGDFPEYISETCKFSPCRTRILGLASISF